MIRIKFLFLIGLLSFFNNCDPGPGYIYVRNYTENEVEIEVEYEIKSDFNSIRYVDYVVEEIEIFHEKKEIFNSNKYIGVHKINDFKYGFKIPKKSTILLMPIYFLIPITQLTIKNKNKYLEYCFYHGCTKGKYYSLMKGDIVEGQIIQGRYPLIIVNIK